jgi:sugar lactone lactonase YvrE
MLLEYDPATRETRCLVNGLYFANGVSLAADGTYLVYAETFTNSVAKLWLLGDKVRLHAVRNSLHICNAWFTAASRLGCPCDEY